MKRFRHMSEADVAAIVRDLHRWAEGEAGPKLTWEHLEKTWGFTRQAMQNRPEIKAAYDLAKDALRGGLVRSRQSADKAIADLERELVQAKAEIAEYERREALWQARWQRIAFHVRQKGVQVADVDKPIPEDVKSPTAKDTEKVLRGFDRPIPPSGRT